MNVTWLPLSLSVQQVVVGHTTVDDKVLVFALQVDKGRVQKHDDQNFRMKVEVTFHSKVKHALGIYADKTTIDRIFNARCTCPTFFCATF